jgi:virulence-associated protein VagC
MDTAKLFVIGRCRAVRLTKAFRFEGVTEVFIQRDGERIILSPRRKPSIAELISALREFEDFPTRHQPRKAQRRSSL